jgi:hypothetical protein
MRTTITFLLFLGAVTAAQAQVYPVQGRWGRAQALKKARSIVRSGAVKFQRCK